jgi:hypothetical protein
MCATSQRRGWDIKTNSCPEGNLYIGSQLMWLNYMNEFASIDELKELNTEGKLDMVLCTRIVTSIGGCTKPSCT